MSTKAIFEGLVFDEDENAVEVKVIGEEAYYVVDDDGFMRHIASGYVDKQVIDRLQKQFEDNKDAIIEQSAKLMGIDDPFSQAAMAAKLGNFEEQYELLKTMGIPENDRMYLGMTGFKIIIDIHGEMLEFRQPARAEDE